MMTLNLMSNLVFNESLKIRFLFEFIILVFIFEIKEEKMQTNKTWWWYNTNETFVK